ncbi:uncharacterized protein N7484_006708 [Penicillium longicatenatum]|uniref:uncharacterized protein n=1 Tax=Penicillium longicatenatum TaxID=1561947 RepID=UPI00254988DC|nr:uncharacterized protein N7484_006708 [Penicillium longicatenatum]KAJ5644201.1 hypothetical protein N7484_006708 [Penicillium longicatenatum]
MAAEWYSLAEVLAVAKSHPFYNPDILYPANADSVQASRNSVIGHETEPKLQEQPLLEKKTLYKVIARLTHDKDPRNTYRHSSYMSITGGGSGGIPMFFAVDAHENRQQRAQMGKFLRVSGVIEPGDVVLSVHTAGDFYRSLDLTTETMENAGATVLSAGCYMPTPEVAKALADYHVNALTGDGTQVINVIFAISMMVQSDRDRICLDKIIYTSEPLTSPQRDFVKTVLGDIKITSIIGSSEAGPWAVSNPDLTGEQSLTSGCVDFVFDTRHVLLEILPCSVLDGASLSDKTPLPYGERGIIVQTSLQRLRNPLVRYITGDVGSLHPLPEGANASVPHADRVHLRVLRLQGRDQRFSFKWNGCYFEFDKIEAVMQQDEYGILQWQIVLGKLETSPQATLEIRLFRCPPRDGILSMDELKERLGAFFVFCSQNAHLSRIVFLNDVDGFQRSTTAGKVIKFLDHWN